MTLEQINIMQEALERKKKKEILKEEYKQQKELHDIKDIFLDAFSFQKPNETKPIVEKLLEIMDQVTNEDPDANAKLMEWSKKKFQAKVNEKISSGITLSQVEMATKIEKNEEGT